MTFCVCSAGFCLPETGLGSRAVEGFALQFGFRVRVLGCSLGSRVTHSFRVKGYSVGSRVTHSLGLRVTV